ncbi:unnamed protein product [Psylliodes chrysocephalus]|uniref:Uncharacterized protein n=1 Tax=Psylliodes chrysocephalus TaxID=3402493 RepID=A0A9P0G5I2_9CUCU|nr:unnamed protein product [Psylliodes chrysocephala]
MVLFTHAFTGCNTTSVPFGQGKTKITKLLSKSQVEFFLRPDSTPQAAREAGINCFVALYGGGNARDTLDFLRYTTFVNEHKSRLFVIDGRCSRSPCRKVLPPSAEVTGSQLEFH